MSQVASLPPVNIDSQKIAQYERLYVDFIIDRIRRELVKRTGLNVEANQKDLEKVFEIATGNPVHGQGFMRLVSMAKGLGLIKHDNITEQLLERNPHIEHIIDTIMVLNWYPRGLSMIPPHPVDVYEYYVKKRYPEAKMNPTDFDPSVLLRDYAEKMAIVRAGELGELTALQVLGGIGYKPYGKLVEKDPGYVVDIIDTVYGLPLVEVEVKKFIAGITQINDWWVRVFPLNSETMKATLLRDLHGLERVVSRYPKRITGIYNRGVFKLYLFTPESVTIESFDERVIDGYTKRIYDQYAKVMTALGLKPESYTLVRANMIERIVEKMDREAFNYDMIHPNNLRSRFLHLLETEPYSVKVMNVFNIDIYPSGQVFLVDKLRNRAYTVNRVSREAITRKILRIISDNPAEYMKVDMEHNALYGEVMRIQRRINYINSVINTRFLGLMRIETGRHTLKAVKIGSLAVLKFKKIKGKPVPIERMAIMVSRPEGMKRIMLKDIDNIESFHEYEHDMTKHPSFLEVKMPDRVNHYPLIVNPWILYKLLFGVHEEKPEIYMGVHDELIIHDPEYKVSVIIEPLTVRPR